MLTAVLVLLCAAILLAVVLWVRECRGPHVVCLMYHRLVPGPEFQELRGTERVFAVTCENLERQVRYLKENGYTFLSPSEVADFASKRWSPRGPAVLVTFDDGCRSVHRLARPILSRHGAKAVTFVTLDPDSYVFGLTGNADPRMTDQELRDCEADGISVESHAVTHRPLRSLSDEEVRRELLDSRQALKSVTGRDISFFAVPGNWWDRRIMQIAGEVGYRAAWVSNPGTVRAGSALYGLPRINIEGELTLAQFAAAIRPFGVVQRVLAAFIKRLPGRLLGPRVWLPIRTLVLKCMPGGHLSMRRFIVLSGGILGVCVVLILLWLLSR